MRWTVAGLIESQFESNDVSLMAIVQGLLPGHIDNVVGRSHDLCDISGDRRIVPHAMKWNDCRHSKVLYCSKWLKS